MRKHFPKLFRLVFLVGFALLVYWAAPLRTALQFGGDEGYELMKGLLCSQGYSLYQEIWNDQPPFHTALLGGLFKIFEPSAHMGRLLAIEAGIE